MWLDPHPLLTPRLSVFGLIQAFDSSLTLPTSHYQYNKWLDRVEIGNHYAYPSLHTDFWVMGGDNFGSKSLLFTPRSSVFVPIQAIDSSLTLPMSHHKYNEWLDKVEIGIWCLQWSPQAVFESWVGTNVARSTPTFHTKIECVWTDSSNWQQLDPSNVSS